MREQTSSPSTGSPLGLPAAGETEDREPEMMPAPRRLEAEPLEIVDAEVVPDEPVPSQYLEAYHGNERLARMEWQG